MAEEKVTTIVPKSMEIVKPVAWSLTDDQKMKIVNQFLVFTSLPALAFLLAIQQGKTVQEAFTYALVPSLVNTVINAIIKFRSTTPYLREKQD